LITPPLPLAGGVKGASSFRIVPTPCASATVAPFGAERLTVNVSSGSTSKSPSTGTVKVFDVWPGLKVRVPDVAV
jgi:hypothetical protein